jgi:hypothetical protein
VQVLQWKHDNEIIEDVADKVFSLLGRAVHQILEWGATGDQETPEERLFMEVEINGAKVMISGAMDLQDDDGDGVVDISDYKVTSVYGFLADKAAWHNQLNCYAHLVRYAQYRGIYERGNWSLIPRDGRDVSSLSIVAILRDWSSGKANSPDYPPAPIQTLEIPLWSAEAAAEYFDQRVRLHIKSRSLDFAGRELPLCSKEERWEDDPKFAVMKEGNKRATAVFEDRDNALEFIRQSSEKNRAKLSVQEREGDPRRCAGDWCRVSRWCSQNQKRLEAME